MNTHPIFTRYCQIVLTWINPHIFPIFFFSETVSLVQMKYSKILSLSSLIKLWLFQFNLINLLGFWKRTIKPEVSANLNTGEAGIPAQNKLYLHWIPIQLKEMIKMNTIWRNVRGTLESLFFVLFSEIHSLFWKIFLQYYAPFFVNLLIYFLNHLA